MFTKILTGYLALTQFVLSYTLTGGNRRLYCADVYHLLISVFVTTHLAETEVVSDLRSDQFQSTRLASVATLLLHTWEF